MSFSNNPAYLQVTALASNLMNPVYSLLQVSYLRLFHKLP